MAYWENELSFWIWLIPGEEFKKNSKTLRDDLGLLNDQNIDFPLHLTIGKLKKIEIDTIIDIDHLNSKINKNKFQFVQRIQPNDFFNSFVYVPEEKQIFNNWIKKIISGSKITYERESDPHISLSYGLLKNKLSDLKKKLDLKISMSYFAIAIVNEEKQIWKIIYPN